LWARKSRSNKQEGIHAKNTRAAAQRHFRPESLEALAGPDYRRAVETVAVAGFRRA
jgi:hypothetical protein